MDLDSIDDKTAFKLGFATRCFELGLEPAQVKEAMEKSATLGALLGRALPYLKPVYTHALKPLGSFIGRASRNPTVATVAGIGTLGGLNNWINAAKDISGGMISLGGGLGLLGGAGLGYGLARMNEEDVDEDEIKAKELADTYKVYTDRLKSQRAYQQYRKAREAS